MVGLSIAAVALALLLAACAHPIPTNICEVTSLSELVELQSKVDFQRISCEGGQFVGYECSRYWMVNNELVRKKLSYDACREIKRANFRDWAGTSTVNGTFQDDYYATLQAEQKVYDRLSSFLVYQQNVTITFLNYENGVSLRQLVFTEDVDVESVQVHTTRDASSTRAYDSAQEQGTRNYISTSESQDRGADIAAEEAIRSDVNGDARDTDDLVSVSAQFIRNYDSQEENNTQNYVQDEQAQAQALISTEQGLVRSEVDAEQAQTRASWLQEATTASTAITANAASNEFFIESTDYLEETETRSLVVSTEESNADAANQDQDDTRYVINGAYLNESSVTSGSVAVQESSTEAISSSSAAAIRSIATGAASNVQATWNGAASNIFALLASFQNGIPSPLYITLSIHLNLISCYNRGYIAVDIYSSNFVLFEQLWSVVNSTIIYNSQKYGSTTNNAAQAASYWARGEAYRTQSNPNYLLAVESYSFAYYYAITPNNGQN